MGTPAETLGRIKHNGRVIGVYREPQSVPEYSVYHRNILTKIGQDTLFVSIDPTITSVLLKYTTLDAQEALALAKAPGGVAGRDAAFRLCEIDNDSILAAVQRAADLDPKNAENIFTRNGIDIRRYTYPSRDDFEVKHGDLPGTANLRAKGFRGRAAYVWYISNDGITFQLLRVTVGCKTTATGLPAKSTQYFKVQMVTKDGEQPFSQIISINII